MLQRVEDEHRSKLEQLSKMQLEQDSSLDFQNGRNSSQTNISSEPSNVLAYSLLISIVFAIVSTPVTNKIKLFQP